MTEFIQDSANQVWLQTIEELLYNCEVEPMTIKGALGEDVVVRHEAINHGLLMDMDYPKVTIVSRDLDHFYPRAEAAMVIDGGNRLDYLPIIERTLGKWSDDDIFVRHAYGPKFVDQLPYVIETLKHDPLSRRAVINVWRDSPGSSKDTACLMTLQFLVRKEDLYCIANMRSSDVWLGLANDLATFTYLAEAVRLLYKRRVGVVYVRG